MACDYLLEASCTQKLIYLYKTDQLLAITKNGPAKVARFVISVAIPFVSLRLCVAKIRYP